MNAKLSGKITTLLFAAVFVLGVAAGLGAGLSDDFSGDMLGAEWSQTANINLGNAYTVGLFKGGVLAVSGAGETAVNRHFNQEGTENNKPRYVDDSGDYAVSWKVGKWQIYYTRTVYPHVYYETAENTATPELAVVWQAVNGVIPLPVLSASAPAVSALKIVAKKPSGVWSAIVFDPVGFNFNMSASPWVSLKVKSGKDINLSAYVTTGDGVTIVSHWQEVLASDHFADCAFYMGDLAFDWSKVQQMYFNFNGADACAAVVFFDDFKFGDGAAPMPGITTVPDQQTYTGAPEQMVPLRGIFSGLAGDITVTASSSNTTLIPNPTVVYTSPEAAGELRYTPPALSAGAAAITVTVVSTALAQSKVITFNIAVESNLAPTIDQLPGQVARSGEARTIRLTGITDGNPNARQALAVTAASSNPALIPNPLVNYHSNDTTADLTLTPAAGAGSADITVTVRDDGPGASDCACANTQTMQFSVSVYNSINNPPTIDPVSDQFVHNLSGDHTIVLTGLGDNDAGVFQVLSFTAASSNPALVAHPKVFYQYGLSTAKLTFTAPADNAVLPRTATITLTVADDGGLPGNNGNASTVQIFQVTCLPAAVTGWADDFNDGVLDPNWNGGNASGSLTAGEGCHTVTEHDGQLQIVADKTKTSNKWAGQWYLIPAELNLDAHPYITVTTREDRIQGTTNPTAMRVYLWDASDLYNTIQNGEIDVKITATYADYDFNFNAYRTASNGLPIDYKHIKALLFNFDPGGDKPLYKGTIWFDALRTGDKANQPPVTAVVKATVDPVADVVLAKNAGEQQVTLTGISDGQGGTQVITVAAASGNTSLIPAIAAGAAANGQAVLSFTPTADQTGSAVVTVTVSAPGAQNAQTAFTVFVADNSVAQATINIDLATTFQTMDGLGAFIPGDAELTPELLGQINELGLSMIRTGIMDNQWEPANDNSNPAVINPAGFNDAAFNWDLWRAVQNKTGVEKIILTSWSPPYWMKFNKALETAFNAVPPLVSKLNPMFYAEFAESLAAVSKAFKDKTGRELAAISLQHEAEFGGQYPSCPMLPDEMRDIIKTVGPRFDAEGLAAKICWPEILGQVCPTCQVGNYLNPVNNDPAAAPYADVFAINYGVAGLSWRDVYKQIMDGAPPETIWATENYSSTGDWAGAMELAVLCSMALKSGHASAWLYYMLNITEDNNSGVNFCLIHNNQILPKAWAFKQFAQFIRPGAVNVGSSSSAGGVLELAFKDAASNRLTVVLINNSSEPVSFIVSGSGLPPAYDVYTSARNVNCASTGSLLAGEVGLLPPLSVTTLVGYFSPVILTAELPPAYSKTGYSAVITAGGGVPPWSWSLAAGSALPAGLSLDSATGAIGGVTALDGEFGFIVQAADHTSASATRALTLTVVPSILLVPVISSETLPGGRVGLDYHQQIIATGGAGTRQWLLLDGALPEGLALSPDGVISGNPSSAGVFAFTAQVADVEGKTDTAALSLTIAPDLNAPAPAFTALPGGTVGVPYHFVLTSAGGDGAPVWSMSLPPGLSLAGNAIAGTPTAFGSYPINITVEDSDGNHAAPDVGTAELALDIARGPVAVTLSNLLQTYDGTARTVSVQTNPPDFAVAITYDGDSEAPVNAGIHTVHAAVTDPNYEGETTKSLLVMKAIAGVEIGSLEQPWTDAPRPVTVTTTPAGLAVLVTYNDITDAPADMGSYAVKVFVDDTNYAGTASATLTIVAGDPVVNYFGGDITPRPDFGAGWYSGWLGILNASQFPLVWQDELGWWCCYQGAAGGGVWIYDYTPDLGWFWAAPDIYPWFWVQQRQSWLYFYEGSGGLFYDWFLGDFVQIDQTE